MKSSRFAPLRPVALFPDNAVGLSIFVLVSSGHVVCLDDTRKPVVGGNCHSCRIFFLLVSWCWVIFVSCVGYLYFFSRMLVLLCFASLVKPKSDFRDFKRAASNFLAFLVSKIQTSEIYLIAAAFMWFHPRVRWVL